VVRRNVRALRRRLAERYPALGRARRGLRRLRRRLLRPVRRVLRPAGAPPPAVAPRSAPDRVVHLALPPAARRATLTITAPPGLFVPRRLAGAGLAGYESDAMACFLAATDVAGPGAVFDVGANVGVYAAVAAAFTDRPVRAFEPTPALAAVARRVAADNDLDFVVEELALGARDGTATLYLSDVTDASNSLADGFRASSHQLEVRLSTLDAYVARTGAAPSVLKVDTETTEPDVLAGAAATVAARRPWILCEVLAGRVEPRLTEVLTPFGYHWYAIGDDLPYPARDRIAGDPTYRQLMWLFAPRPPDERFWTAVRERRAQLDACTVAAKGRMPCPTDS
jgi:FkbM family methyltransferase